MNIIELIPTIYGKLIVFILVFARISALLSTFILFRRDYVNRRIIISLSGILAVYMLLFYDTTQVTYDVFSIQMIIQMMFQSFIGFVSGLILNIIFEIFMALGQVISMQIGLGMASLLDPRIGSITTLTRFYMYSIVILFLSLNGHLFVIKTLIDSFAVIPINHTINPSNFISAILNYSSVIFSGSVLLSITIIVAMMLTNFALALMTKFAPQFNIFSIGINLTLVLGLILIYFSFDMFVNRGGSYIEEGLTFFRSSLQKLA